MLLVVKNNTADHNYCGIVGGIYNTFKAEDPVVTKPTHSLIISGDHKSKL